MSNTPPETETLPVEFSVGLDEATGMYQVGMMTSGIVIGINVHPSAFPLLEGVLNAIPEAVLDVIEQFVEASEANQNPEETP